MKITKEINQGVEFVRIEYTSIDVNEGHELGLTIIELESEGYKHCASSLLSTTFSKKAM